jgi:sterol-4alpha-carboxylate 3-dehydrogenase (decarboxylating)
MIGDNENLFDMTYVDNAAYAHILAAERMTANSGIDGQAFIITNDQPIFFWDYPKAIYEGLGYKETQKIVLSKSFGLALGSFMDTVTWILSPFVTLHPSFTRFRVVIINGNRYFNIAKAKKLLGYSPIVDWNEAVTRTVQFYKEQESH